MFGKPNLADADLMLAEASAILTETATALEAEHPDPTATDAQALTTWIFETIVHVVLEYGRTDPEAIRDAVFHLTLRRYERPDADQWAEPVHEAQATRLRALLARYVRESRPGLNEAAAEYSKGLVNLQPGPALSSDQFVRVAVTPISASMTRLQNEGYLKVR